MANTRRREPAQRPGAQRTAHILCALALSAGAPLAAQDISAPERLAGVSRVAVRASADWDELITTTAGGATADQFREALLQGFTEALRSAEAGPTVEADAPAFVLCHVDTFYDSGLIVYSVRVSLHMAPTSGPNVITWLQSSVGSYTAQQLHVIWTLGDQCARAFVTAWRSANPGPG